MDDGDEAAEEDAMLAAAAAAAGWLVDWMGFNGAAAAATTSACWTWTFTELNHMIRHPISEVFTCEIKMK